MERSSMADDPDISDSGFLIAPQGMNKITKLNIEMKLVNAQATENGIWQM